MGRYSSGSESEGRRRRSKGGSGTSSSRAARRRSSSSDSGSSRRKDGRPRDGRQRDGKVSSRKRSRSNNRKESKPSKSSSTNYKHRSRSRDRYRKRSPSRDRNKKYKSRNKRGASTSTSSSSSATSPSTSSSKGSSPKVFGPKTREELIQLKPIDLSHGEGAVDHKVLAELNSDSFVPKQFISSSKAAKKVPDNIVIDLKSQTIKVPDVEIREPDSIFHPNLFPSEEARNEKWIKELFMYRQKALSGGETI